MTHTPVVTLVTAANQNYFLGLFLLAASVERWQLGDRLLMFHTGLDADSERWLRQFRRVELRQFKKPSPFGLHCRKAEAMLEAGGDYIAWLDSDCLVVGDLNGLIIPANGQLQARLRTPEETRSDLGRFYAPGETPGSIPKVILNRWQRDVGERDTPRIGAMVPSNVLVFHARFKPFLEHWDRQIQKVLDPAKGTLDLADPAYYLTDESVLNSLLVFAHLAPEVCEYRLALERNRHVAHFMGSPKPWVRWSPRNLYCLAFVLDLIEWMRQNGREVPPLPPALRASRRRWSVVEAHVAARLQRLRSLPGGVRRRLGGFGHADEA
jgi:hypothetical protein